jgi:hypothetical protein
MSTYRMIFSGNTVLTIVNVEHSAKLDGNSYVEHDRGRLIFAIINAENEQKAQQEATRLAGQLQQEYAPIG